MHDEEVRVVYIELDGLEEILDRLLLRTVSIDEIFACAAKYDLARDRYLTIFFKSYGRLFLISIVEDNCNASFGDTSLASFIDQVLAVDLISVGGQESGTRGRLNSPVHFEPSQCSCL